MVTAAPAELPQALPCRSPSCSGWHRAPPRAGSHCPHHAPCRKPWQHSSRAHKADRSLRGTSAHRSQQDHCCQAPTTPSAAGNRSVTHLGWVLEKKNHPSARAHRFTLLHFIGLRLFGLHRKPTPQDPSTLANPLHVPSGAPQLQSHAQTFTQHLYSIKLIANRVKKVCGGFSLKAKTHGSSVSFHRNFLPTVHWTKEKV